MGFGALLGGIGAIAGPILNAFGQENTNDANRDIASANLEFQRDMSNTAYQRAVNDMHRAGLNPMLAYSRGGASTPTGAQAEMQNPRWGDAATGVQQAQLLREQVENVKADTRKKDAEAALVDSQVPEVAARIRMSTASAEQSERSLRYYLNKLEGESEEAQEKGRLAYRRSYGNGVRLSGERWPFEDLADSQVAKELAENRAALELMPAEVRKRVAEGLKLEFQLPGLRNIRDVDETSYGKYVKPYLLATSPEGRIASSAEMVRRSASRYVPRAR